MRILGVIHAARAQGLAACSCALLALGWLATPDREGRQDDSPEPGRVKGKVILDLKGVRLADVGPIVVFLDAVEGKLEYELPKEVPAIHQTDATFVPSLLVIVAGQTVELPNDDTIFHNVFSYSKPNEFDVGIYPKDSSRAVVFRHPGVVRIYCSIHASMNGVIFVAPSPYVDRVGKTGVFGIADVPEGKYRLRTWNSRLPEYSCEVEIKAGEVVRVDVVIKATGSGSPGTNGNEG